VITLAELQPGSSEPASPHEVDLLLTFVPELSFLPPLAPGVPRLPPGAATHQAVDDHFRDQALEVVVSGLRTLTQQAAAERNGGLAFLVRTLLHFIEEQPVPPSQHPLLVALYLRGVARAAGQDESPRAIAAAMDRWS
jgi:hypothetical protein